MTFLAFVTKVQASHYTSISLQYVETLTVLRHIILYSYIMGRWEVFRKILTNKVISFTKSLSLNN